MTDPKDTESAWDRGFEAAFAESENQPGSSVLERLGLSPKERGSVYLPEPDGESEESPIVKAGTNGDGAVGTKKYQVVGEIARGGVGIVFKGRDVDLGRDVAMKVLRKELAGNPQLIERFVEEAQVGGQLQHPGIVPVYEIGIQKDGRPFFAMKLVKGKTLSALFKDRADITKERRRYLSIFENVCQTMAYAHARNVIHRDLKPSNVMVGSFGEVLVVDWGFAKVVREGGIVDEARAPVDLSVIETVRSGPGSSEASVAGSVMGTPAYMPPEQARGDQANINTRSDVFALGGVLCELLTGLPPYADTDGNQLGQAIRAELGPALARLDACGADDALVQLTKQCLEPQPMARPAHAGEVAAAVNAYLSSVEDRAEEARLEAEREKGRADVERKARRRTLAMSTMTLIAIVAAGGLWLWNAKKDEDRRQAASSAVAQALVEAGQKLGAAQSAADGKLDGWPAVLEAAQDAIDVAKASNAGAEDLKRAQAFLADAKALEKEAKADAAVFEKDQTMREEILALRLMRGPDFPLEDVDRGFREAFVAYGIDVDALRIDALVDAVEASRLKAELAGGLERWAHVRRKLDPDDVEGLRKLRETVKRLDPDPFRTRLRVLDDAGDVRRLRRVLEESELDGEATESLVVAGRALLELGAQDDGFTYVSLAAKREDADFWAHAEQAFAFMHFSVPDTGRFKDALEAALVSNRDAYGLQYHLGKLIRVEDVERAIDAYREVWDKNPAYGNIRKLYVEALGARLNGFLRGSSMARATGVARAMLEIAPDSAVAHGTLGRALTERVKPTPMHETIPDEEQGKLNEAIEALERAVEIDPDAGWRVHLAAALNKARRFQEALDQLDLVDPSDAGYARAMIMYAAIQQAGGNLDAAEAILRELMLDPNQMLQMAAVHPLIQLLRRLGRIPDALRIATERAEASPGFSHYHILIASMQIELARFDEAEDLLAKMARELGERTPPQVHLLLGEAVALQNRFSEAKIYWTNMFRAYDKRTDELRLRGAPTEESERNAYYLINQMYAPLASYHQWKPLLWLFREGRRRYPDLTNLLWRELGTLIRLKRGAEAVDLCLERLQSDPYDGKLLQHLAAAIRHVDDLADRITKVEARLAGGSKDPLDHLYLAHLRWAAGDLEGAERQFRALAAEHPKAAAPYNWLCLLHEVRREWDKCAEAARESLARRRKNPGAQHQLGNALQQMGRQDEAREAFEQGGRMGTGHSGHLRACITIFMLDGFEAGMAYAKKYHLLPPLGPGAFPVLAWWLHISGANEYALHILEEQLETHPGSVLLQANLAYFLVGKPGATEADRRRALELSHEAVAAWSDCSHAWDMRAYVLYRHGRYKDCVEAFEKSQACRAYYSDQDARLAYALALWHVDRKKDAKQALDDAREAIWERLRGTGYGMHVGRMTILGFERFIPGPTRHLLKEAEATIR